MNPAKPELRRRTRRLGMIGSSQRTIAADLGVSRRRVRQLVAEVRAAEERFEQRLAAAGPDELERQLRELQEDRRWLDQRITATRDELHARAIDATLGLR